MNWIFVNNNGERYTAESEDLKEALTEMWANTVFNTVAAHYDVNGVMKLHAFYIRGDNNPHGTLDYFWANKRNS